jgi:signal transduction histidine kinase
VRLERARVDLRAVAEAAVETAAATRPRAALVLPHEPVWVEADEVRLAQAIGNLLTNAQAAGGHVRVRVAGRGADGGAALVEVTDDGHGFDPPLARELFEPFRQAGDAGRGLGLGLAIVRGIVHAHGGDVEAYSAGPGRGARFTILLP